MPYESKMSNLSNECIVCFVRWRFVRLVHLCLRSGVEKAPLQFLKVIYRKWYVCDV